MNHFKVLNKYSIHDFLFAMHTTQIKLCVVLERKGHSRNAVLPTSMKRNLNWCKNVILQLYELLWYDKYVDSDFLLHYMCEKLKLWPQIYIWNHSGLCAHLKASRDPCELLYWGPGGFNQWRLRTQLWQPIGSKWIFGRPPANPGNQSQSPYSGGLAVLAHHKRPWLIETLISTTRTKTFQPPDNFEIWLAYSLSLFVIKS